MYHNHATQLRLVVCKVLCWAPAQEHDLVEARSMKTQSILIFVTCTNLDILLSVSLLEIVVACETLVGFAAGFCEPCWICGCFYKSLAEYLSGFLLVFLLILCVWRQSKNSTDAATQNSESPQAELQTQRFLFSMH